MVVVVGDSAVVVGAVVVGAGCVGGGGEGGAVKDLNRCRSHWVVVGGGTWDVRWFDSGADVVVAAVTVVAVAARWSRPRHMHVMQPRAFLSLCPTHPS